MFEQEFFGQITNYYVPHEPGIFDKQILVDQFPVPEPDIKSTLIGLAKKGFLIWAGIQVLKSFSK